MKHSLWLGALGGAVLGLALRWGIGAAQRPEPQPAPVTLAPALPPSPRHAPPSATPAIDQGTDAFVAGLRQAMGDGVLAGTQADGGWPCLAEGLKPDLAVRRRFDWYANQLGRFSAKQIESVLAREAQQACGPAAGAQAARLWRQYQLSLASNGAYQRGPRTRAEAAGMLDAIASQRRAALGQEWGEAFFGEEERRLRETGAAENPSVIPEERADASERLARLGTQWQDWQQRLNSARQEARKLGTDPRLSPAQRDAALEQLISTRFAPAEQARATALLRSAAEEVAPGS